MTIRSVSVSEDFVGFGVVVVFGVVLYLACGLLVSFCIGANLAMFFFTLGVLLNYKYVFELLK